MQERRRSRRIPCRIPLRIGAEQSLTANISRHGLFVETTQPRLERDLIQLVLHLPEAGPMKIMALVSWVVLPDDATSGGHPPGFGCEFYMLDRASKHSWDLFVEALAADGASPQKESPRDPGQPFIRKSERPKHRPTFIIKPDTIESLSDMIQKGLAEGGVFTEGPSKVNVGCLVDLVFVHPDTEEEFIAPCSVASIWPLEGPLKRGVELLFEYMSPERIDALRQFSGTQEKGRVQPIPKSAVRPMRQPVRVRHTGPTPPTDETPLDVEAVRQFFQATKQQRKSDLTERTTTAEAQSEKGEEHAPARPLLDEDGAVPIDHFDPAELDVPPSTEESALEGELDITVREQPELEITVREQPVEEEVISLDELDIMEVEPLIGPGSDRQGQARRTPLVVPTADKRQTQRPKPWIGPRPVRMRRGPRRAASESQQAQPTPSPGPQPTTQAEPQQEAKARAAARPRTRRHTGPGTVEPPPSRAQASQDRPQAATPARPPLRASQPLPSAPSQPEPTEATAVARPRPQRPRMKSPTPRPGSSMPAEPEPKQQKKDRRSTLAGPPMPSPAPPDTPDPIRSAERPKVRRRPRERSDD